MWVGRLRTQWAAGGLLSYSYSFSFSVIALALKFFFFKYTVVLKDTHKSKVYS